MGLAAASSCSCQGDYLCIGRRVGVIARRGAPLSARICCHQWAIGHLGTAPTLCRVCQLSAPVATASPPLLNTLGGAGFLGWINLVAGLVNSVWGRGCGGDVALQLSDVSWLGAVG